MYTTGPAYMMRVNGLRHGHKEIDDMFFYLGPASISQSRESRTVIGRKSVLTSTNVMKMMKRGGGQHE